MSYITGTNLYVSQNVKIVKKKNKKKQKKNKCIVISINNFSLFYQQNIREYILPKSSILDVHFHIVNWITMTRKSGKHLQVTYRSSGQLLQP